MFSDECCHIEFSWIVECPIVAPGWNDPDVVHPASLARFRWKQRPTQKTQEMNCGKTC